MLNDRLLSAAFLALAAVTAHVSSVAIAKEASRPNILFIFSDDLGSTLPSPAP